MSTPVNHDHLLARAMVAVLIEHNIAAELEWVVADPISYYRPKILDDKSQFIYNLMGGKDYFWEKYMRRYQEYYKAASESRKSKL